MLSSHHQTSYLTVLLVLAGVYFMWMDVALYINLQRLPSLPPLQPSPHLDKADNASSVVIVSPSSSSSTITSFSPVYPVRLKLLMTGPVDHYVVESLGHWTVAYTGLASHVTANAVSIAGVVLALVGCRLVASDCLRTRQLGVLFMFLRDYADSLDGWVARARDHHLGFKINTEGSGYYMDGICDGVAYFVYFWALAVHLYKSNAFYNRCHRGDTYWRLEAAASIATGPNPIKDKKKKDDDDPKMASDAASASSCHHDEGKVATRPFRSRFFPCFRVCLLFGLQVLLSGVCWNMAVLAFHRLLETYEVARTHAQLAEQNLSMKSSTLWILAYLWRWVNPIMLIQYSMVAVLYNKAYEYLVFFQRLGFVPVAVVAIFSQVYYWILHANLVAAGVDLSGTESGGGGGDGGMGGTQ